MKVELTKEDMKRLEKIKRLSGSKEALTESNAWIIISNALVAYESQLTKGEGDNHG